MALEGLLAATYFGSTFGQYVYFFGGIIGAVLVAKIVYFFISKYGSMIASKTENKFDDMLIKAVKLPIIFTNWELALAVLFYFIAGVLFILALKTGELIQVFPVLATSYVWVSLAGMWIFGEVMTFVNWVGIAFIVCGVAALALGRNK